MNNTPLIHQFLSLALLPLAAGFVSAQEETIEEARRRGTIIELEPMRVVGSRENVEFLPGSAAYIDVDDIRSQSYDDINRLVQRVPGVYFREEDGFGIFSNLSLRGANANRSSKVTMMEDGVLTNPAPYSAPAAYYTPTAGRMHGVEILKGSSQILYGPETTGGVINYLSTPIPQARQGYVKALYGTNNDLRLHANYGDVITTPYGNFGFLIENYHRRNDGFKKIDERPGFNRGDDTGFTKNEPMLKLAFQPHSAVPQRLEFKIGYTDLDFNETYLGLTEEDFRADPYRRYAASRFDNIQTDHTRTYLRHVIEPSPDLRVTTTAYYNSFGRNWYKVNDVSTQPGGGNWRNLSQTLAGQWGQEPLDVLRGDSAGAFRVRANKRDYELFGIENLTQFTFETGAFEHSVDVGVRLHQDSEKRFQHDTVFSQNAEGAVTGGTVGAPGSQDSRQGEARAVAFYVQDRIAFDRFAVTPGFRVEHIGYEFRNLANPAQNGTGNLTVFAPGVGLTYDHTNNLTFFSGIYRGFSTPSPSDRVRSGIKEESTISFELGSRYNNRRGFRSELVFFHTDFKNLIVPESIGSGQPVTENVGEATSYGIEALVGFDPGVALDWSFRNPNYVAFTWTDATLDNDTFSANAESIFSGGRKGNRLPYIPRYMISAGTGMEFDRWGLYLDANYQPWTYTTASNTSDQMAPDGTLDARYGRTDSRVILDLSAHYRVSENAKVIAGIHNLLDEEYVASRLPHGPRPGQPLTAHIGLEVTF
jgi:Fe(3+) dicitrate transport protein